MRWWKKGNRGVHLYYMLWQWGAYNVARNLHRTVGFDVVHHVTFVSVRQPSFMGNLGIPFIFGPVAGGEKAPWRLRFGMGWRGWLKEGLRDLANLLPSIDPLMWATFLQAERIYVTSDQTRALIPRCCRRKVINHLAIGIATLAMVPVAQSFGGKSFSECLRVIYVGRFIHWKGMKLGLAAFARLLRLHPGARLTMVGKGPDESSLRQLAANLGVTASVDWLPWMSQPELSLLYQNHDIFLFPSLHDSGGLVVLEAMVHGLPVICLNIGGPGEIVSAGGGIAVPTRGLTEHAVIFQLADALLRIANNPALHRELAIEAVQRARDMSWQALVRDIVCSR